MEEFTYIVIFITAADTEEAELISRVLLGQRQAACVNIVPNVSSHFWWQEKIDSGQESLLIVKTRVSSLDNIVRLVREIHSYEVPEIIALPIIGGNQDYLDWLGEEVYIKSPENGYASQE